MEVDRSGLEVLSREDCIRLLAGTRNGRVAFHAGAVPVILPVAFTLGDDHIVVRVGAGPKLDAVTRDSVVAFETDGGDPDDGTTWSVTVTGMAGEVGVPDDVAPAMAGGDGDRLVRISLDLVSGRRGSPAAGPGNAENTAHESAATASSSSWRTRPPS